MTRLNEVLAIANQIVADRGDKYFPPATLMNRCREAGIYSAEFRAAVEEGLTKGQLVEEPGERLRLG